MMRELLLLALLTAAVAGWLVWQHRDAPESPTALDATVLLSAEAEAFARVTGPAPVIFPADHAAHPDYRHEWWYFTGNLDDDQGRRYGFQFTLFRFATAASMPADSAWSTNQLWMAHLALSDVENQRFLSRERLARGALDLAGATESQWWLKDWQVVWTGDSWRLVAAADEFALELELAPRKPAVLQGDNGYSRKGPEAGNATRYLSWTRLETSGTIGLDGHARAVTGLAWLDREWGTSALGEELAGWDWFALQLDDGRELMFYHLRERDGSAAKRRWRFWEGKKPSGEDRQARASPFSAGVLVDAQGRTTTLDAGAVTARPLRWWRDEAGIAWPVAWELVLPEHNLVLHAEAVLDAQLWDKLFRYWEGAVDVFVDEQAAGRGYLEMTGYDLSDER